MNRTTAIRHLPDRAKVILCIIIVRAVDLFTLHIKPLRYIITPVPFPLLAVRLQKPTQIASCWSRSHYPVDRNKAVGSTRSFLNGTPSFSESVLVERGPVQR